ncbi:cysteine--tRNA ligase, partial [Leclercia adecarboxylata]|uniref:DALR domain-containing protein n=3 Tax=Gammaproteobacteria TaxID=1236 RepID=UPI002371390F
VDSLTEARKSLTRLYTALEGVAFVTTTSSEPSAYRQRFTQVMDDDFNTPEALAVLFELAREVNRAKQENPDQAPKLAAELKRLGAILGLLQQVPQTFLKGTQQQGMPLSESEIETKIAQRIEAKANKDFAQADAIRDELAALGIILKDSREGT